MVEPGDFEPSEFNHFKLGDRVIERYRNVVVYRGNNDWPQEETRYVHDPVPGTVIGIKDESVLVRCDDGTIGRYGCGHTELAPSGTMVYWVSWYHDPSFTPFELHWPWWVSGSDSAGRETIVAAVPARSPEAAQGTVLASYDLWPTDIEWRFCDPLAHDDPIFTDRFPRADWMANPRLAKAH